MKTEFVPDEWSPACTRCGGYAYEYLHSRKFHQRGKQSETLSIIQCLWCLQTTTSKWQPPEKLLNIPEKVFVFSEGRFSGKTLEEVSQTENGHEYLCLIASGELQVTEDCLHATRSFLN